MVLKYDKFLESKGYSTLYHYTSSLYLLDILSSDKIKSDKEIVDLYMDSDNEQTIKRYQQLEDKYPFFISTTRNRNFHIKAKSLITYINTKIYLDGKKLSSKYKVIPVNWYNASEYDKLRHEKDENEEAILLRKGQRDIKLSIFCGRIDIPNLETFKQEIFYYNENEKYNLKQYFEKLYKIHNTLYPRTENKDTVESFIEEENIIKYYNTFKSYIELYSHKYNIEIGYI